MLLLTLDTTRADALGCYGCDQAATPALDSVAQRGALFTRAYAQVPLTTPSHCSILTGRYPREHGVRINGKGALPDSIPTLATIFEKRGYSTGAFISAFVLDSRFGLDRGFDVYDEELDAPAEQSSQVETQRGAEAVTDRALEWLSAEANRPFFCWIHYYDPHYPYAPPLRFRTEDRNPYYGEIEYMDSQIQRVLDWLDAESLADRTLVVVVGDHGEAFGEHGEFGHLLYLYETNVRVPLILAHPRMARGGLRIDAVVESVDLVPTLMDLLGWEAPEGLRSRSLGPAIAGGALDPRPAYAESLHAHSVFGWAEQRALISDTWKFISSSDPELYNVATDPAERNNLVDSRRDVAMELFHSLQARFSDMTPGSAGQVTLDAEARKKLESLGYVGGAGPSGGEEALLTPGSQDPKGQFPVYLHRHDLQEVMAAGRENEAARLIREAARWSPESPAVEYARGYASELVGDHEQAMKHYREALAMDPSMRMALRFVTDYYLKRNQVGGAIVVLNRALEETPDDLVVLNSLAQLLACSPEEEHRDGARALALARRACDRLQRRDVTCLAMQAAAHAELGAFDEAVAVANDALKVAEGQGRHRVAAIIRTQIEGYEMERPCRQVH